MDAAHWALALLALGGLIYAIPVACGHPCPRCAAEEDERQARIARARHDTWHEDGRIDPRCPHCRP